SETSSSTEDGTYRLTAPDIGAYYAVVEAPGYLPQYRRLAPFMHSVDAPPVKLKTAAVRRVTVVDPAGTPVVDAAVELLIQSEDRPRRRGRRGFDGWSRWPVRQLTDGEGRVRLPFLPVGEGTQDLVVVATGYAPFEAEPDGDGEVRVQLVTGSPRAVRVLGADGRAAADVLVRRGRLPVGRTDDDGRLTVAVAEEPVALDVEIVTDEGVERGELIVTAASGDGDGDGPSADAAAETLDMTMEAVEMMSGVVVDGADRRPIPGALVVPSQLPQHSVFTDKNGTYTVEARRQFLYAAAPGYRVTQTRAAGSQTEAPTLALEPAAELVGRVVDGEGEPVAGASFRTRAISESRRYWGTGGETVSRPDGSFHIRGLPADVPLELRVESAGHIAQKKNLEPLRAGEVRGDLEFQLAPTLAAVGQVVDAVE
ncbi:MAG: hypothetical protein AAFX50_20990, partial [Acidobacteriota bacterium]